jgi:bacterioferritin-associated ferredoxin
MYVCICNAVSDGDIREAVRAGARSMRELQEGLKVATQCGRCSCCARDCLERALAEQAPAGRAA